MATYAVPFDGTITKTQPAPTFGGLNKPGTAPTSPFGAATGAGAAAAPSQFSRFTSQFAGQFGPGRSLIASQFNPTASKQTQQARTAMNIPGLFQQAVGSAGVQAPGLSQQTGTLRDLLMRQAQGLEGNTPDRAKLAADTYGLLEERSRPQFETGIRQLGQKTAALGRVGSGLYNTELSDLATERERGLDQSRRQLATESAGMTLQDALNRLSGVQGAVGTLGSQDISLGGLGLQAQGQQFGNLMDLTRFGADYTRGLSDEDFRGRQEMRGERDYQYGLSRDALNDRRYADDVGYRRAMELGFGSDPSQAMQFASQNYGQSGREQMAGGGDLLGDYLYRRQLEQQPRGSQGAQRPVSRPAPDYTDASVY